VGILKAGAGSFNVTYLKKHWCGLPIQSSLYRGKRTSVALPLDHVPTRLPFFMTL
jgi:hypothetical protein